MALILFIYLQNLFIKLSTFDFHGVYKIKNESSIILMRIFDPPIRPVMIEEEVIENLIVTRINFTLFKCGMDIIPECTLDLSGYEDITLE